MESCDKRGYYVGIDIGSNSVGWAVTDLEYHIIRKKGKSLWGIRLFEEASTAAERRLFRTNRRRLQRRKQRIRLLQELFAKEMEKVDAGFFQRMNDSACWEEDKKEFQIYSLFSGKDYTDIDYYKEYPTIYHLRSALLRGEKEFDLRLVYLALHHLMKHRGHFLFAGEIKQVTSFHVTFQLFLDCLEEEFGLELECDSEEKFAEIMKNKRISRLERRRELEQLCHVEKEDRQKKELFKLITGMKASLPVIFADETLSEIEHNKISFSESGYEETRLELEEEIQERTGILDIFYAVYSWVILADILAGGEYEENSYLSMAKVNTYDKHRRDLHILKRLVREYCPETYHTWFSSSAADNYCAYIGSFRKNGKKYEVKRCSQEDFYKSLKKIVGKMPTERPEVVQILEEIENRMFLPRQVSKDNGVIPYQVNKMELEKILGHAERYLPFLLKTDPECQKTVRQKIVDLFEFRIPYYVGPLNTALGENCWAVRREQGAVYPWNFDRKVDRDESAKEFIQRMTNQCTYLIHENVLPRYSLLYSEFMVLNELNNVRIRDEKLPVELKKEIVQKLFKKQKRVTGKKLLDYLNANGYDVKKEELSGFDGNFKASLSSGLDLKRIFGAELEKYAVRQMAEDIILWITLYGEDQKMLRRVIRQHYGEHLGEEKIEALVKLKFKGWGRLSRRFLNEMEGVDCTTGECMTIMKALEDTQNNLMQLLSRKYTFAQMIDEENGSFHVDEITYEHLIKDMVVSPAVKRAVWQTVQIVEEIKQVMGCEPKKIFVEMARGPEEKKGEEGRKASRRSKLIEAYAAIRDEARDWQQELQNQYSDGDFKAIKLYLYYTQMGQCMYTGEKIDLSQLNDATIWDRDHIYPQSKTKDDSLDNLVLVKKTVNAKKDDGMISQEIQRRMKNTWRYLREKGLISEIKYERLTRTTPLTEEELAGFINRQLVETRQSSKAVASLLGRVYEEAEIVYVKAKAVSDFRRDHLDYVKVRDLNDYHHAKDAYQNIVVGNVYHTKFTDNPLRWLKENPQKNYSLKQMFSFDLEANGCFVWKKGKEGSIKCVRDTLRKNDILFTRYAFCNKGGLFNQTISGAPEDKEKAKGLVPIKKGMNPEKYGGYTSVTPSHFILVASEGKKGKEMRTIETVPLYRKKEFEHNPEALLQYCREFYGLKNPRILISCIKKNARLVINGFPVHLKGSTGKQLLLQGAVQLCLNLEMAIYIKKVTKYLEENAQRRDKRSLLEVSNKTGITKEGNSKLYAVFLEKLNNKIYQHRPANPRDILLKGKEKFENLNLEEQCVVLGEILHLFQCKPLTGNLSLIGASPNTGKIQTGKIISNCNSVKLVDQSVTGIFERVTDLLTI